MLATNLQYNSQERYIFEEVYINGKIELIKINKEDYQTNTEHKQIIIEMSEGIENSEQAQELKAELEEKLKATIKVIKHTADEQNVEEHYHFQILSNDEINNQSIYKVANDFIKAIKGEEMTQVRIYDNSQKNSFDLSAEATAELLKVKEDKFSFIKKDSKSHEIEEIEGYTKEGSKNATGLGKLDRPTYILNGISNEKAKLISRFGIGMFRSDELEITEETAKQAIKSFYMSIGQELGENWDSFLNVEIQASEEELSVNFNNLIVLKNGNVASTAKNLIEEHLSKILKNAISNEQLIIENDDRLKPKEKVLGELQYLSGQEHISEAEQEEKAEAVEIETIEKQAEQSQATTDFYLDFMVEIKQIKTFEELEAKKAELESEAEKVEAVRGILPVELINEKLEQIATKKELLSIVKVERTEEQELKEEFEATKESLAAQTQTSKKLQAELVKRTEELEATAESLADTKAELEKEKELSRLKSEADEEAIKSLKTKLEAKNYDYDKLLKERQKLDNERWKLDKANKELKAELEAEQETTNKLNEELKERTHELGEARAELKAEKAEVKKYNKLYSDIASKLKETENKLESVNKKLADKEQENKSLTKKVKDLEKELKSALNEVEKWKKELEIGKEEAKNYLLSIEEQHQEENNLSKAYIDELEARIKELEESEEQGEKTEKKKIKTQKPGPKQ